MIPFWKKTVKHSKPQSAQKRRQNAKSAAPRTAPPAAQKEVADPLGIWIVQLY